MTKILVIMLSRGVGGLERRTSTMYKHLTEHDLNCHITFLINRSQLSLLRNYQHSDTKNKCNLILFGLPHQGMFKSSNKLSYIIDYIFLAIKLLILRINNQFDIAYFTKFASLPLRHFVPAKHKILALVDSYSNERIINSKIFDTILAESFTIDCLSPDLRSIVLNKKRVSPHQIQATPCSFIDYSNTHIGKKSSIITFCGRLTDGKGIELLLTIIPNILRKHSDLQIRILGDGPLLPKIEKMIQRSGSNRITVRFTHDPVSFLHDSLIFLSLQEKENYPSQALIEAMACGNAIIATNVGSTQQLVTDQVGLLIPPDPKKLFSALNCLLDNPADTLRMGNNARKKVTTEHTIEKYLSYFTHDVIPSFEKLR